jgi:hypothetical protein
MQSIDMKGAGRSRIARRAQALVGAALLALLAGCASPNGPGEVARNWSCKLREMQIQPVFPPREDVQVGDTYLLPRIAETDAGGYCKTGSEFLPLPTYVAYVNLTAAIDAHYNSRPHLPRTVGGGGTVTIASAGVTIAPATAAASSDEATNSVFANGSNKRTRLVGFPDFMSVHISRFALGAIVPIQSVLAPIGIATENVREASISIPVAESYAVPAGVLGQALVTGSAGAKALCAAMAFVDVGGKDKPSGELQVVTEVFYTRAIDVDISAQSALSLSVSRSRSNSATVAAGDLPLPGIETITRTDAGGSVVAQITRVSDGMVQILQSRGNVPGVSLAYEQGDALSVKMRRIFDRPVAIGFRSVTLKADQLTDVDKCKLTSAPPGGGTTTLNQQPRS